MEVIEPTDVHSMTIRIRRLEGSTQAALATLRRLADRERSADARRVGARGGDRV